MNVLILIQQIDILETDTMSSYSEILRSSSEYSVWLSNLGEKEKYLKVSGKKL